MSDEENKNEEKPQPGFKTYNCGDKTGVFLNGVTSVEDPDERCKNVGDDEIEIEVVYRLSPKGKIATRAKIPAFLLSIAGKIAGTMAKEMSNHLDQVCEKSRAYDEGFKAGQEAAHKPAADGEAEATPSPAATPEAGTEAPAAE